MGFQPGDILGVILPNLPEYPIVALGAMEAGIIVSPMNPVYTVGESFFSSLIIIIIIVTSP